MSSSAGAAGALLAAAVLIASCSSGAAVRVEGVRLLAGPGPQPYVLAGQAAELECRFALEPLERVQGVTWAKDGQLVYRWLPSGRTLAFGVLENATTAAAAGPRAPWHLYITKASPAMAGNYSCSVHTDRGSASSRRYRLAVLLVCKARIETEDSTGVNCSVGWRVTCSRVFPDLNLTAGVFDPDENKFVDRVTEWTKVVYSDNTYGYHAFKSYHVAEIPRSSVFLWSLSYGDQTPLVSGNVSSGAVHRAWAGCPEPPPPQDPNLQVLVHDGEEEREGDRANGCRPWGVSKAVYTCANEVRPSKVKKLACVDGEWKEEDRLAPWPVC